MKAIETSYKGYRFRSRLEARWAVFFDTLGIKWEYEKEGYILDGKSYLPDFWLPQVSMWAEVKAEDFTPEQKALCKSLVKQTGKDCLLLVGPPDYKVYFFIDGNILAIDEDGCEQDCYVNRRYLHEHRFFASIWEDEEDTRIHLQDDDLYVEAVNAARGARFEHEERIWGPIRELTKKKSKD